MQATRVSEGRVVDYTPNTDTTAGTVVVQNDLIGIPANDIPAGRLGALAVEGVFSVVKVNGSINPGALVYWDADANPVGGVAGSGAATTTADGNKFLGYATRGAGAGDARVQILMLHPLSVANTIRNELSNVVADPGNAGAIPVTTGGICPLVTAGAETRTLAAPTYAGQQLALAFKTDGGDCVVTCATGVNMTGNTTLTFDNAGEVIVLIAIEVGSNLRWRVQSNDGVGLTTP